MIDERNYDAGHRVFRSPFPSSAGPLTSARARVHLARAFLTSHYRSAPESPALRASLHPFVGDLEEDWSADPERRGRILDLFDRVVLGGDVPTNLTAAGLVTHAFLFTGDDRYRRWVLDYARAWIERIDANGGLLPDNVGPAGRVGERRRGQWWGGLYGWTSRWAGDINFGGPTVAAECALLLSGDSAYLELLRRPLLALLERSRTTAEGRLEFPKRMGPEGWTEWAPQTVYNGGLLRATVRHFDLDRGRPGLPPDVACLVEELSAQSVDLRLVNTGRERRRVLVQAGAFGEHEFTRVEADGESLQVGGRHFAVELAPQAGILLRAGLRRFVHTPSYGAALDRLKAVPAAPRAG